MEIIRGKHASVLNTTALAQRLAAYTALHVDIGTGDGRFVTHMARTCPERFVIGVDACRENLRETSRSAPDNALYIIANALALPTELAGLATHVSINFPWGSLIEGLLAADESLLGGLHALMRPHAGLEVRLNAGALAEAGWSLEAGAAQVHRVLRGVAFVMAPPRGLNASDLRAIPTTWAKRLAFGRDPRAVILCAERSG